MAKSVVKEPNSVSTLGDYIISLSSVADDIPVWGTFPATRDKALRDFWPTEPILASAIFSTASKYAAFGWSLVGPPRTQEIVRRILHGVEFGKGWMYFILKVITDLFTADNGAFIEVVRSDDSPLAPVVSLNHLDSSRCRRTGARQTPVIYYDIDGNAHALKWYQVITLEEFPSPIERYRGLQYCCVTRLLRAAQIMRDISVYKREKISGRFSGSIHLVSGVQKKSIDDAMRQHQENASNKGLTRYIQPLVIASLDPTAEITKQTIELASLPDHFDEDTSMRIYVNQLALAFAGDYQDYAPLPAGNLGTSQQSQILHLKSRGKGPALFMSLVEHSFNFHGVMPATVHFQFGEQDISADLATEEVKYKRAQTLKLHVDAGIITPEIARQILVDSGDLDTRYLKLVNESNATPDVTISGSEGSFGVTSEIPGSNGKLKAGAI